VKNDPYNLNEGVTVVVGRCRQRRTEWLGLELYPESAFKCKSDHATVYDQLSQKVEFADENAECPTYAGAFGLSWSRGKKRVQGISAYLVILK
jgi:hypothetical protein